MGKRLLGLTLACLVLIAAPACAQSSEIEALRKEIADLREDLASLRASLGRARPIIDLTQGHQKGSSDAVVALIEFSDYECPFCIRHSRETMPLIEKNYISTGKVLYGFRDFPIDQLHPQAIRAHEAAQCAGDQQKYWEMHARMFGQPSQHTPELLERTGTEVGLDLGAFRACMATGTHTAAIRQTVAQAESFGANGTPAFFIGIIDKTTNTVRITRAMSGALPFAQFAQALEGALAAANK
ncbi:MAG: DsbA family protein [Acidobacteria bacterium]|nr:DsbA family protein [Acidobacteriota bacterium]